MFRRRSDEVIAPTAQPAPTERVTSVLGSGVVWKGNLSGAGGYTIEGAFEGEIALRGLLVVGETGRVTCQDLKANAVIVAGAVRGDITCEKLEIRATGRVRGTGDRSIRQKKALFCAVRSHGRAGRYRRDTERTG